MSTLVLDKPMVERNYLGEEGRTLGDVITGVWEDLLASRTVSCPVCSRAMTPRFGSGPGPVGGSCGDCGSVLG